MRIANFAYSWYINYPEGLQICDDFNASPLMIRTDWSRRSRINTDNERISLTTKMKKGRPTPLYYATCSHDNLNNAISHLRRFLGSKNPENISYLREGKSDKTTNLKVDGQWYTGRWKNLKDKEVVTMARFLAENKYDAGIFPEFNVNYSSEQTKNHPPSETVCNNTWHYYDDLPDNIREAHEKALVDLLGKQSVIDENITDIDNTVHALRIEGVGKSKKKLVGEANKRIGKMEYDKTHKNKNFTLKNKADCVGAVRYLLRFANYELRKGNIDVQPERLLTDPKAKVQCVICDIDDLHAGDVVFFRSKNKADENESTPTHMTVALGDNRFFHCTNWSPNKGITGAMIENYSTLTKRYDIVNPTGDSVELPKVIKINL